VDRVLVADQLGPANRVADTGGSGTRDLERRDDGLERLRIAAVDIDPEQLVVGELPDEPASQRDVAVAAAGVVQPRNRLPLVRDGPIRARGRASSGLAGGRSAERQQERRCEGEDGHRVFHHPHRSLVTLERRRLHRDT
jgi:hypothetical protein